MSYTLAYVRYPGTRKTIFVWVSRYCNFIFYSLWHFIANCVWSITECDSYFNTNFNKSLLQKESGVLLQIAILITKWDVYYKTRRYKQLAKNHLGFVSLLNIGKTWRKKGVSAHLPWVEIVKISSVLRDIFFGEIIGLFNLVSDSF